MPLIVETYITKIEIEMCKYLNALVKKIKRRFLFLLAVLPYISACADSSRLPKPPLDFPFPLENLNSKIEKEIKIVDAAYYSFSLRFMYERSNQKDRARVKKILDSNKTAFLKLSVSRVGAQGEQLLLEEDISDLLINSWGGDNFTSEMGEIFLSPGLYKFSVVNLRAMPEFDEVLINFSIARSYKGK